MSKWLKLFLFGIWGVLLIPLIAAALKIWLQKNFFSGSVWPRPFLMIFSLGEQRWFELTLLLLTGVVNCASLEWLVRKSDDKRAYGLRSLGFKFTSLSDSIKNRTASAEWPLNVHDLRPAILSAFISAKRFDLWVPSNYAILAVPVLRILSGPAPWLGAFAFRAIEGQ